MAADDYYKICCRRNEDCQGRITWEHAILFKGKQLQKKWCIIPLCLYHHLGRGLKKEVNVWIAINRATDEELQEISGAINYQQLKIGLNKKYDRMKRV